MNFKIEETIEYIRRECPSCWVVFWIPESLFQRSRNDPKVSYCCPNGHDVIQPGPTIEERLQEKTEECSKRKEDLAELRAKFDKRTAILRGQITRLRRKIGDG